MVCKRVGRMPPVEALELIAAGDHVVMSVRGVAIGQARGHTTIVYTLKDGKIVRMHDYLHRAGTRSGGRVPHLGLTTQATSGIETAITTGRQSAMPDD